MIFCKLIKLVVSGRWFNSYQAFFEYDPCIVDDDNELYED